MSSEGDERMKPSSDMDYLSSDDAIEGNGGENDTLKKGPWTSAEDEILMKHVKEHGEGSWNAVKKLSGLARCGKSCRLRWMNHLRPELKKGAFTPEEERRIVELHAKMGNKWARMAVELPGRTDNEIKNYWNTRIKKRQRAGLPIYPDYICLESLNENLQSDDMNNISSGDVHQPDDMPNSNYEIPTVEFTMFEFNPHIYPPALLDFPASRFLDIPANRPPSQCLTYSYKSLHPHPTVHQSKRIHESESLSPPICSAFPTKNQYQSDESMQIDMSSVFSTYNHNLEYDHARSSSSNGSHAILNGHPFSEPAPAMKQELPSLQTQMGMWGSPSPSSPFPFSEFIDDPVPTPLSEQIELYNVPQDTGLLDDVLYESRTMKNPISNGGFHQTPNVSSAAVHTMDNWEHVFQDREWRGYQDQLSPIGHSSSSFFSESTPISGNSFDDPFSAVNLPVVDESVYGDSVSCDAEVEGLGEKPGGLFQTGFFDRRLFRSS